MFNDDDLSDLSSTVCVSSAANEKGETSVMQKQGCIQPASFVTKQGYDATFCCSRRSGTVVLHMKNLHDHEQRSRDDV